MMFSKSMLHSGDVVRNREGNFYLVIENNEAEFLFSREDGSWYNDEQVNYDLTMENSTLHNLDIMEIYFPKYNWSLGYLFSHGLRYVENNRDWRVVKRNTLPKYTYSDLVKFIGHEFAFTLEEKETK